MPDLNYQGNIVTRGNLGTGLGTIDSFLVVETAVDAIRSGFPARPGFRLTGYRSDVTQESGIALLQPTPLSQSYTGGLSGVTEFVSASNLADYLNHLQLYSDKTRYRFPMPILLVPSVYRYNGFRYNAKFQISKVSPTFDSSGILEKEYRITIPGQLEDDSDFVMTFRNIKTTDSDNRTVDTGISRLRGSNYDLFMSRGEARNNVIDFTHNLGTQAGLKNLDNATIRIETRNNSTGTYEDLLPGIAEMVRNPFWYELDEASAVFNDSDFFGFLDSDTDISTFNTANLSIVTNYNPLFSQGGVLLEIDTIPGLPSLYEIVAMEAIRGERQVRIALTSAIF